MVMVMAYRNVFQRYGNGVETVLKPTFVYKEFASLHRSDLKKQDNVENKRISGNVYGGSTYLHTAPNIQAYINEWKNTNSGGKESGAGSEFKEELSEMEKREKRRKKLKSQAPTYNEVLTQLRKMVKFSKDQNDSKLASAYPIIKKKGEYVDLENSEGEEEGNQGGSNPNKKFHEKLVEDFDASLPLHRRTIATKSGKSKSTTTKPSASRKGGGVGRGRGRGRGRGKK